MTQYFKKGLCTEPLFFYASKYAVRWARFPHPEYQIHVIELPASIAEISAELEANAGFYVSVQAVNADCSGPDSELLAVQVLPA